MLGYIYKYIYIYVYAAGPDLQPGFNNEEEVKNVGSSFFGGDEEGDSDGGPSGHYAYVFISLLVITFFPSALVNFSRT